MIKQLTIIGLGFMGGSLAKAAKKYHACNTVVAYDLDQNALEQAQHQSIIDIAAQSIKQAVENANIIMLATPVNSSDKIFYEIKQNCPEHAVISDMGSCKQSVITAANQLEKNFSKYVPGHPITGSEKSGFMAANENLFCKKTVILTPTDATDASALERIRDFWQLMEASVIEMPADKHDQLLALTSHLPHILAITFMNNVTNKFTNDDLLAGIGGGFRDFTRIASADPTMWADICLANKTAIYDEIENFEKTFASFRKALTSNNYEQLLELFSQAKKRRSDILE